MGIAAKKIIKKLRSPQGKKLLYILLFVAILFRPVQSLYEKRDTFLNPGYSKKYETFKSLYYSSQYVQKNNPTVISDNILDSFAGGAFLKGMNPILIIHDQPPLGRYITALSIFLFDNQLTLTVPLSIASLLGMFLLGRIVLGNTFFSLVPLAIFANEPLFLNTLSVAPLIETMQLPFILFSVYCFIRGIQAKQPIYWFISTSLLLGCVISIRFFVMGAGLAAAMVGFLLIKRRMDTLLQFLITLPLAVVVLMLSYFRTLQLGYSVIQILGIQKYILFYHKSKFILPFTFWDLLLFNKWHTWWGDRSISFDPQWIIFWPITTILSFISLVLGLLKKIVLSDSEIVLFLWLIIVCSMLSTGFTSTRYFLPVVPFFYILGAAFLQKIYLRYRNK